MNEVNKKMEPQNEEINPLVDSWVETLANSELSDILTDLSEMGLDSITENELLKEVPIVSTVVSAYKIGHSLRERSYMKKLLVFLHEIDSGKVSEEKKAKYINRITKNKRNTKREIEYVLALLDRLFSEQKANLFAKLYLAYINDDVNWDLFRQISELLDRFLPGDVDCLDKKVLNNTNRDEMEEIALHRLQGLGVVIPNAQPSSYDISGNPLSTMPDGTYSLTALGRAISNTIL